MARRKRLYLSGYTYHVVHRGNNRQPVFAAPLDFIRYQDYLLDALLRYGVFCHAYVQMSNHVHLLLSPGCAAGISRVMSLVGNRYVQYFNYRYGRSGTLWEGRHRSCVIETDYHLWACHRYVELNPVRADMVPHPQAYYWSSHACNALGVHSELVAPHMLYRDLGSSNEQRCQAYRKIFQQESRAADFEDIRRATRSGVALGPDVNPTETPGQETLGVSEAMPPNWH